MFHLQSAARFVDALRSDAPPAIEPWTGPAGLRGTVAHPRGASRGTILAIHGMSPLAERDPRWTGALSALAAAGYTAISPRFDSIAALRIEAAQIDAIATAAAALAEGAGRGVGIFAVSLSAGLAAAASARPAARGAVRALCAIGGWSRLDTLLPSVLASPRPDPYARFVILANFAEAAFGPAPAVRRAFLDAAEANFAERPFDLAAALEEALAGSSLPAPAQAALRALGRGEGDAPGFLRALGEQAPGLPASLEPIRHIDGIEAAVTLVHGLHDPVIPCAQSRELADRLRILGGRHRLCVTPLLGHGDTRLPLRALVTAGLPLLAAFAGYFKDVARA